MATAKSKALGMAKKFNSATEQNKRLKMRYSHPEKYNEMEKGFEKHNKGLK